MAELAERQPAVPDVQIRVAVLSAGQVNGPGNVGSFSDERISFSIAARCFERLLRTNRPFCPYSQVANR